jgi:quercetin dioxygenase-like cupin family protein
MHTHKPYIAYFFGPWKGRFTSPEGKTSEKEFKTGDLICSPKGKTHALEIIGKDDQLVLVVEFKTQSEIDCTGQKAKE